MDGRNVSTTSPRTGAQPAPSVGSLVASKDRKPAAAPAPDAGAAVAVSPPGSSGSGPGSGPGPQKPKTFTASERVTTPIDTAMGGHEVVDTIILLSVSLIIAIVLQYAAVRLANLTRTRDRAREEYEKLAIDLAKLAADINSDQTESYALDARIASLQARAGRTPSGGQNGPDPAARNDSRMVVSSGDDTGGGLGARESHCGVTPWPRPWAAPVLCALVALGKSLVGGIVGLVSACYRGYCRGSLSIKTYVRDRARNEGREAARHWPLAGRIGRTPAAIRYLDIVPPNATPASERIVKPTPGSTPSGWSLGLARTLHLW